jgi:hypothetical protein
MLEHGRDPRTELGRVNSDGNELTAPTHRCRRLDEHSGVRAASTLRYFCIDRLLARELGSSSKSGSSRMTYQRHPCPLQNPGGCDVSTTYVGELVSEDQIERVRLELIQKASGDDDCRRPEPAHERHWGSVRDEKTGSWSAHLLSQLAEATFDA